MAVIAEVSVDGGVADLDMAGDSGNFVLVKGSPEALKPLLAPNAAPRWYDRSHLDLAERGLRVLALAYRQLPIGHDKLVREEAERDLRFAGFIAFECLVRKDSGLVVGALQESDHKVIMVTGDSPLTALHIARTCGISHPQLPGLLLSLKAGEDGPQEMPEWLVTTGDRSGERFAMRVDGMEDLSKEFALMTTGEALDAAVAVEPAIWSKVDEIRVFARMTPQGKAKIIEELQKQAKHVLMCGDGGNDVGALKQADAGLALLAGYGNVNTADTNEIESHNDADLSNSLVDKKAEEALNQQDAELAKRNRKFAKDRQKFLWEKQKEFTELQKQWLEEEMQARAKNGETGILSQVGAMKTSMGRYTEELKKVMKEYDKTHGNVYDAGGKDEALKKSPAAALEEASGGLPMVRPGDASIAAPFTSKAPSVKNCVDLIRQGRCTLLSALQQQQIMMLNCIINAYVLSALSLEGSRTSERQLMTSSWLLTTASLAFTYASPCDRMHPVRPLRSLFHPAVFFSMLGQAAIHLFCMVAAVKMARAAMEEGSPERLEGWSGPSLKDVADFWKRERARRRGLIDQEEEEDWTTYALNMWKQPFLPNLMNTVVFLVETAQTVAILFVNYKGQPWMKGVVENRALFLSVVVVAGSVAAAAWEFQPQLNELIHLSPFPNDQFRWRVMGLVGMTLVGTFVWDRFCVFLFAKDIFKAIVDSAKKTTFRADIVPIFVTVLKVVGVFIVLGTGNLLMAGLAFWMYRRHAQESEE
mmetsp:Transcript_8533/g.20258  ORF Transcript_8533/g.20258 Transcript_8533/m.20258 type:complete len:758 (+) Transcript_8533:1-2274(+)